jgi:hypothetical protein
VTGAALSLPGIFICIRRTLDWQDEAVVTKHLRPGFRPKLAAWNATFDPPYHLFRHRLKQIAQENLSRVARAVLAPIEAIPRGAVVIPVDDDDWLSPELAERLAERYDPAAGGYLWIREVVEPPRRLRTRLWNWAWSWKASTCATNNYAVVNEPELTELLFRHVKAGRYFDANRSRILRIPQTLAIQNRNLSSQTAMAWRRPSIAREELVESLRRYRTLYAAYPLPAELGWARPCLAQMAELMGQVRVK